MITTCQNTIELKTSGLPKIGMNVMVVAFLLFISNALQAQSTPKPSQYSKNDTVRIEILYSNQVKPIPEEKVTKKDKVEDSVNTSSASKVEHSFIYELLKRFMILDRD